MIEVNNPTYVPVRWHATLLTIATALGVSCFNIFLAGHLSLCEGIFSLCHVFAFVPVAVSLWVLAPKQPASEVFLHFTDNGGGWPNIALSVLVGQVSNMFVVLGSDGVAHLAEEIEDAGLTLPKSMVWSYILNAPLAIIMVVTICFNVTSVQEAVSSTMPFVYIFAQAFVIPRVTMAFSAVMLGLLMMITVSALASTSRQTFAFARDKGLPFSDWLSTVNRRFEVPANAILVTAAYTTFMALINIGSTVAFSAMVSLSNTALMTTYMLSIGSVAWKRLNKQPLPPCRWSLGRAGLTVNCLALLYSTWAFFWSFWPSKYPSTATNFNWCSVLFVGFSACALVLYRLRAKRTYEGPVVMVKEFAD